MPELSPVKAEGCLPIGSELFSITDQSEQKSESHHVVVCGEEIGGTDALMPVLRELLARNIGVTALLAGNGRRILSTRGQQHGLHITPLPEWTDVAKQPSAVLLTPSEDGRLEEYLLERYRGTPTIEIEDYHESSRRAIDYAHRSGLKPPTVCVIDTEAKRLINRRFPGADVPVIITGSPTFDILFDEDRDALQRRIKEKLGVPEQKLVTLLIPRLGHTALANEVAASCEHVRDDIIFALRPHPSDVIDRSIYEEMFRHVSHIDTSGYHTDEVATGADLVIAQRSVTILRAVVRQQPTITLNRFVPEGFTLPLVDSGASLPALPEELPSAIDELLEGTSDRCIELKKRMKPYEVDGQSASRIAEVVWQQIS